MRKLTAFVKLTPVVPVLLLTVSFLGNPTAASAQEASKESASKNATADQPTEAYRVDMSFNELEDTKKLNTRHYSLDVIGGRSNEIKIGTRVPVVTANCGAPTATSSSGSEQYQYIDLGTSVSVALINHGQEMHVVGEVSSVDTTTAGTERSTLGPIIRQIRIEGNTPLVLGKPIMIGIADDPNSRRQFQLEATVTKLN